MRIKQTLAAFLTIASVLSCAACGSQSSSSTHTSSTSSSSDSYAKWLDDRLGDNVGKVTIGLGNDKDYGIDMSDFEDDGYIIRNIGTETLIFGKTDSGLDRAVRKYAKNVEAGTAIEDVTFHEGPRIEKLTLFGTDISEFTAVVPNDNNENMKFAKDELVRLIAKACGVMLPVVFGESSAEHQITFRFTDNGDFRDDGYRYYEEDGSLVFEGAVDRGCMNAVYRFLQNECGWDNLMFGDSRLREADLVAIPEGIDETEIPALDYINPYTWYWFSSVRNDKATPSAAQTSYGPIREACHGLTTYRWNNGENHQYFQPCFTSESVFEAMYSSITHYINSRIASGETPGVQFKDIDIAMGDNDYFCHCKNCSAVLRYDKSNAGPMVQFANKLGEELEATYPGAHLYIKIFAYFSAKKPPAVTTGNEFLHVTYCSNGNCANHPYDGSKCSILDDNGFTSNENHQDAEWVNRWLEVTDNVYVWTYAMDSGLHQYTVIHTLLPDIRYFKEIGIKGWFSEIESYLFGIKRVEQNLMSEINWQSDMTDEEYDDFLCQELEIEYGEGWRYIRAYIDLWIEAQSKVDYFHCWVWADNSPPDSIYNEKFVSENYEKMIGLVEKAVSLADNADQQKRCEMLSCHVYYESCFSTYFRAYDANDTATIEQLNAYYDHMVSIIRKYGFSLDQLQSVSVISIQENLEDSAWIDWIPVRDCLTDPGATQREMPEKYRPVETDTETGTEATA